MITDFHSHILPNVDDGSTSLEESIAMLRMEAEQGITHVVATPHFYADHDSPERFLSRRDRAEAELRAEMAKHTGLPTLSVGAEVSFFQGISASDVLREFAIKDASCVLLEMPMCQWTNSMYREIEQIQEKQDLLPVIAHVDRYISPLHDHGIPNRLAQLPVAVQANASFFLRFSTSNMAMKMLRQDSIHLLGSDCHNLRHRPPNLGDAVERIRRRLGEQAIESICYHECRVLGR